MVGGVWPCPVHDVKLPRSNPRALHSINGRLGWEEDKQILLDWFRDGENKTSGQLFLKIKVTILGKCISTGVLSRFMSYYGWSGADDADPWCLDHCFRPSLLNVGYSVAKYGQHFVGWCFWNDSGTLLKLDQCVWTLIGVCFWHCGSIWDRILGYTYSKYILTACAKCSIDVVV